MAGAAPSIARAGARTATDPAAATRGLVADSTGGPRSRAVLALLVALGFLVLAGQPAQAASADAATELATKYAPIVVLREQKSACGPGEAYKPVAVSAVLGQSDVVLRGPQGQAITAPTAKDLAGKGEGWYLDLPGNPLDPGCDYEQSFKSNSAANSPTVYARVATDPNYPDKLALQYWFYYTFNDWNDKHESDWEMIQLVFPASTPAQALRVAPEAVAYAQHEGSQVAKWDSSELVKQGNHPVVYPGQGSHAAYFRQAVWFGKSASAGFGCDNTDPVGVAIDPKVEVIPTTVPTTGQFAWLDFDGRWGQKEPSFNNGPTGPQTKTQWNEPITWMVDEGRANAVSLPRVPGPALQAFCNLTATGSLLFIGALDNPLAVGGLILVLLLLAILLISRTDWRHPDSAHPDRTRRAGQIITGAFGWLRRHFLAVAGLAGVLWLTSAVSRGIQIALLPKPDVNDITGAGQQLSAMSVVVLLVTLVFVLALVGWVTASAMVMVRQDALGAPVGSRRALALGAKERPGIFAAIVLIVMAALLTASLVLIPIAAWLVSMWAVAPAAAVVEGHGLRAAFGASRAVTKHHRWRTLIVETLLMFIGITLAGLVGAVLLLVTSWPFWVTGLISGLLLAVLLPVAFVGTVLQYYDLRARAVERAVAEPEPAMG